LFLGIGGKTTTKIDSEGVKGAQMLVLGSKMVKMSNFTHSSRKGFVGFTSPKRVFALFALFARSQIWRLPFSIRSRVIG